MLKEIHAFDLDNTLIAANCSFKFGQFLYSRRYFSTFTMLKLVSAYALHQAGLLSITALHHYNFRHLFLGKLAAPIHQYAAQFAETLDPYAPCFKSLLSAQEKNFHTLILSSSPDFIVQPIAKRLGVTQSFATHYEIDKDYRFCNISSIMLGDLKAETVIHYANENNIPLAGLTAYSDSHLDLPFLESAAHPIGVNPDKRLRRICVKQNWPII